MTRASFDLKSHFSKQFTHVVEVVEAILAAAVATGASDIHCDPRSNDILIRFRIDGMLEEVHTVSRGIHEELIARLKILSGTRTDVHAVPQDGRWNMSINGSEYNVRASFMPTYHGENTVLRILPTQVHRLTSFAQLGFIPDHVHLLSSALEKKHGLILVVGPTGSGKTTTLHTCLTHLAPKPLSIITLEDPVEYEIAGVRQIHVRHDYGVSFASGLRSSLRQDPDILMVGEIRDGETARVAIHTALTGHLVFSTLHTNSALESIPRLLDMGVDSYLLASTVKLIVSQRLVRKLCENCGGEGCGGCRGSGYLGRSVIAEVCEVDKEIRDLMARNEPITSYADYLASKSFRTILDDGLEKVEWGVTTKEEVLRVLDHEPN